MIRLLLNKMPYVILFSVLCVSIFSEAPASADIFYYSWEYNSLYNEKVALELELESMKRQFKNEVSGLRAKIKELENKIEDLNQKLDNSEKGRAEDNRLSENRIKELQKVIDILKKKGSDREKKLIDQNERLQEQCNSTIDELRENFRKEGEAQREQLAKLKAAYEKKINGLEARIRNLNEELANIKKLSDSQKHELDRMMSQANELEKQLQDEIKNGEIRLKRQHEKIIINIDDKISFDSGRAILKKEVLPALGKISRILSDFPENQIIIEGHTDNIPIKTRQFRDNWQLSTERALAVLNYLLRNTSLDPSRFAAEGCGEYRPIVSNDTPENRSLNRRVDIVVLPRLKSPK